MILPTQIIRKLRPIEPFVERGVANGMTFGVGPAGYDVRVAEDITLWPINLENLVNNWLAKRSRWFKHRPSFCLASTVERFDIPTDITFKVEDKSSFARRGLSLFNTTAEPGWRGVLTLELKNQGEDVIEIPAGSPIAAICLQRLEEPTEKPYAGRYQDQKAGPQPAIRANEAEAV
jgi:dCTP deaminase